MATWTTGNNITFDEDRHGQAHIYNVVRKQPLAVTNEECFAELKKLRANMVDPIKCSTLWEGPDPLKGHEKSTTLMDCTIRIPNSDEVLTLPMWQSATASDVIEAIAEKFGTGNDFKLFYKMGCNYRTLRQYDSMVRNVWVKGLTSFKRQPYGPINHPFLIIGAGHIGLKSCIDFIEKRNYTNFVCMDRISIVGGTSWQFQANSTSKLQTEFGCYHLDYDEKTPIPDYFKTPWPSRDDLLWHFQMISERKGLMPYIKLNTNVTKTEVVKKDKNTGPKCCNADHYLVTLAKTEGNDWSKTVGKPWEMKFQGISLFPGNLTIPRRETYHGEELFGGQIEYGMFGDANYGDCTGKNVALIGHGAFAIENVRTCCEFHCAKIFLVCRRKNIACPRVSSWFCNRSLIPLSGKTFLDSMVPMYKMMDFDVWTYYAVNADKDRKTANIQQKVRFAIGDIYFLAGYYGKMEVVVEPDGIKRLGHQEIVLPSGRHLTNVNVILKLLGFVGLPDNDRLLGIKALHGFHADGDPRRYCVAEPVSVSAANFSGTSFSPGVIVWAAIGNYFQLYPQDFQKLMDSNMMPVHKADDSDPGTYRPAYVVDARHGTGAMMACMLFCPPLSRENDDYGFIKPIKHRLCHPVKQFIEEATADWDHYCRMFIEEGYGQDKAYPHYPYTVESTRKMINEHMRVSGEPLLATDPEDLGLTDTGTLADLGEGCE